MGAEVRGSPMLWVQEPHKSPRPPRVHAVSAGAHDGPTLWVQEPGVSLCYGRRSPVQPHLVGAGAPGRLGPPWVHVVGAGRWAGPTSGASSLG